MSALTKRTGAVIVWQGDDYARLRELEGNLNSVAQGTPRRMGDPRPVQDAAGARDSFAETAKKRALVFELQALGGRKWRALKAEHPPRDKHADDAEFGFNVDTGGNTAISRSLLKVTKNGRALDLASEDAREELFDDLSDADFSRVLTEILVLNEGEGPDPKLETSTLVTRAYGATEPSPNRLG